MKNLFDPAEVDIQRCREIEDSISYSLVTTQSLRRCREIEDSIYYFSSVNSV